MRFSWIGLFISILILSPNLLFIKFSPRNIPKDMKDGPRIITVAEGIGRVGCLLSPIVFGKFYFNEDINIFMLLMITSLTIYYILWLRYFIKGRGFALLFEPLWFIPVPMAVFPILYFLFAALWGNMVILGISAVVFAAGHIPNSLFTYKLIKLRRQ